MVKLYCDRCEEEIKDKYYTISFWGYDTNPNSKYLSYDKAQDCGGSYTRESALELLNSRKMFCKKCRNEIENFFSSKQN